MRVLLKYGLSHTMPIPETPRVREREQDEEGDQDEFHSEGEEEAQNNLMQGYR